MERGMAERAMRRLSVDEVAAGCHDEARRPRREELGYCFELFCRALDDRSQVAWQALAAQYHHLILEWVYAAAHPADPAEAEEAAREALERFWRTLAGQSEPVARRFAHAGALLNYLQQCAVCTVLDRRRRAGRLARLEARLQAEAGLAPVVPGPEELAVERIERAEQLRRARAWVEQIADPLERQVLGLSFGAGLSPAEIAARHPELFADAQAVRQLKERVLRRARRALLDGGEEASAALSG
jgi:RNA polymerase sigma factor (sigma-70 family)